jgi:hypothetical protein
MQISMSLVQFLGEVLCAPSHRTDGVDWVSPMEERFLAGGNAQRLYHLCTLRGWHVLSVAY